MACRKNLGTGHQAGFLRAAFGQHQLWDALACAARLARQRQTHGQRATYRPQLAAQ